MKRPLFAATCSAVLLIAKGLNIGEASAVVVDPPGSPVIFNFLPGAKLKLKKYVDLFVTVLAPATSIKISPYYDEDGFGALYTTKTVSLKAANVYGYLACP